MKVAVRVGRPEIYDDEALDEILTAIADKQLLASELRVFVLLYSCKPNWQAVRSELERNGRPHTMQTVREYARRAKASLIAAAATEPRLRSVAGPNTLT